MFSLNLECRQEEKDFLVAELWERGSIGLLELEETEGLTRLRAFFESDLDADPLIRQFAAYGARFEPEEPKEWVSISREGWQPRLVGSRFFLVPEWRSDATPPDRLRITINPGLACGTGAHEATQLCLEALERFVKPGMVVLDVGTGSGILSVASALLGAGHALACDLDPVAVEIARRNFRSASVPVSLFTGSADAVRPQSVDLIIANISAETVVALTPEFFRCLSRHGLALLSGFESGQVNGVQASIAENQGDVLAVEQKNGWMLIAASAHAD